MNPDTKRVYGINLSCQILEINRGGYYKWLKRQPTEHELENAAILAYIIELEEANNYIFGVKRLTMYINMETPYHVSQGRVRRIMRKHHIYASIRVAKHDRKAEAKEHILGNKLLNTDATHAFHPNHPDTVWVTDCSELSYGVGGKGRVRLSAIKDLYDHRIVAYAVAGTETQDLVTRTFSLAIEANHGIHPEILHSDQGSAYTSGMYNTVLAGNGVLHSMSRPGTPGDNSPMESFWSHSKVEYFAFERPMSELELRKLIDIWINKYNNERRQETLNGMTPIEYRNHAVKEIA